MFLSRRRGSLESPSVPPAAVASKIHVFDPLANIGRCRGEGQRRYRIKRNIEPGAGRKIESLDAENHRGEANLRGGIELRDRQRLDLYRLAHDERNHEGADNHDIARDDEDGDRRGKHFDDGERDID